jgi:phage terminase small subunit
MASKAKDIEIGILPLNDNQKHFAREYVLSWNRVKSYMKAYPDCEYKSASASATRLLDDVRILTYIEEIKNNIEDLTGVSKVRNINELVKIAYSSIANLHNTWITLKDFKELTEDQTAAIESTDTKTMKVGEDGEIEIDYVKIKLYPKITAIQEINKMMGYNAVERIDHTNAGGKFESTTNITYDAFSDKS